MKTTLLGLLAETSIHPGSGQDTGFVDLPVAREAATDYPVIVGSSMKGALLDRARSHNKETDSPVDCNCVFGEQESAGALIVSDARLVALPIRCLTATYKWVTCPHLLERLGRDLKRTGGALGTTTVETESGHYLGVGTSDLFLEERLFEKRGDLPNEVVDIVSSLIAHDDTKRRVANQLVILHNDDFAWFARYGLSVNARNVLDNEKKTSKNLWYEETIPPDSLFYCLLAEKGKDALSAIEKLFEEKPYLQVGGNETVGQGWFAVQWDVPAKGGAV